jgi:hypothetical protein
MKTNQWALCLSLAAATLGSAAKADTGYFANASLAQASCGSDQVVWIDLDRGRYYKVALSDAVKGGNGVYACERAAHAKYREGKVQPTTVAKE